MKTATRFHIFSHRQHCDFAYWQWLITLDIDLIHIYSSRYGYPDAISVFDHDAQFPRYNFPDTISSTQFPLQNFRGIISMTRFPRHDAYFLFFFFLSRYCTEICWPKWCTAPWDSFTATQAGGLSTGQQTRGQSWALSVFLNIFNNKKWFYCIFHQINNLFLHQSYLKSPLPVKLTW